MAEVFEQRTFLHDNAADRIIPIGYLSGNPKPKCDCPDQEVYSSNKPHKGDFVAVSDVLSTPGSGVAIPNSRPRYHFLDGLRGLSALYVVLYHTYENALTRSPTPMPAWLLHATRWMSFGHYAVAVFIVLSGYSLMLPVVQSTDGTMPYSVGEFFKRRSRRILPPYYAALLFALLVSGAWIGLQHLLHIHNVGRALTENFDPLNLLTHLLLIHNLTGRYAASINPPAWSVATEWQIYLLFPFLLLPIWRRFGVMVMILTGFGVGLAPHYLLPAASNLDGACFWYTGLFALGMTGAVIGGSRYFPGPLLKTPRVWGAVTALLALSFGVLAAVLPRSLRGGCIDLSPLWLTDLLVGLTSLCLIVYCKRCATEDVSSRRPLILHLLELPALVALGGFSYSLYLIHSPVIGGLWRLLIKLHWSGPKLFVGMLSGVPLIVGFAYLFYLSCERYFLPRKRI